MPSFYSAILKRYSGYERGEKVTIYGDYDCDGVCASVILLDTLEKMGADVHPYIPDRHREGYGLNMDAVEKLAKTYQVLVTVDCGITSVQEVALAKEKGMQVIVTDHHTVGDALPAADAVVTPHLGNYPFPGLCGAGVAWKLALALAGNEAEALMDIAAMATVADMVPLLQENRAIVKLGLEMLNCTRRPGLIALMNLAGLEEKVAECYKEADYLNMLAKERAYLMQLDSLRYKVMSTHEKLHLMQARVKQQTEEHQSAQRMHELGEMEFADYQVICRRLNDGQKELQEMEQEHLRVHLEMVKLLGLHFDMRTVELRGKLPTRIPAAVALPTQEQLVQHPLLRCAMAQHGTSEAELQREIRKQYPELNLGSGFEHEGDEHKIGLELGVTLPLWNRNKEGIAKATAERDIKEYDAVQTWRDLLLQGVSLTDMQKLLLKHCRAEHERVSSLAAAEKKQEEKRWWMK